MRSYNIVCGLEPRRLATSHFSPHLTFASHESPCLQTLVDLFDPCHFGISFKY